MLRRQKQICERSKRADIISRQGLVGYIVVVDICLKCHLAVQNVMEIKTNSRSTYQARL